jgi:hypothetical protein
MKLLLPISLLAAPLLVGCVADPQSPDDEAEAPSTMRLVASVQRDNGNVFEFEIDDDGIVSMSEHGPVANGPSISLRALREAHPLAIYRALSDEEPPPELAALRTSEAFAGRDADARVELAPPVAAAAPPAKCTWQWFQTRVCDDLPDEDKNWCKLDETENSAVRGDDFNDVLAIVCVEEGSVVFQRRKRVWWDWSTDQWPVAANDFHWWSLSGGTDYDFMSRVRDAGGDRHSQGGYGCDENLSSCPLILPDAIGEED